jgi:hypothetical protein
MLADGEYARLFRLQAQAFLGQRNPTTTAPSPKLRDGPLLEFLG